MKKHLANAVYGLLDYASYPLGMLLVAPLVLRHLGTSEFGLWMVSTSVVSAGGIIATGLSDAGIQRIAQLHGSGRIRRMISTVRTMFALNLILGCMIALVVFFAAPFGGRHLATLHLVSEKECIDCLRIAGVQILFRAVESFGVIAQRALQEYRGTVQISIAMRALTLCIAAILAAFSKGTESIMIATTGVLVAGATFQLVNLRRILGVISLWPMLYRSEVRILLGPGVFVWLQVAGSVAFRQFDRILLGVVLGAGAVTPYALCIQISEPLFGMTASTLSFFFPYLSKRSSSISSSSLANTILKAFLINLALVLSATVVLLIFGQRFLQIWTGQAVAHGTATIFPIIVVGAALSGLSVTGTYAVQALGQFRIAAFISLGSRTLLLLVMFYLLRHAGLQGLAFARLLYGAAALLIYIPLIKQFSSFRSAKKQASPYALIAETEGGMRP